MKVALVDMDGCIADERHRNWIVGKIPSLSKELKQDAWDSYHKAMWADEPFKGIIDDVNSLPFIISL